MGFSLPLTSTLRQGSFPLLTNETVPLWTELVFALENGFDITLKEVNKIFQLGQTKGIEELFPSNIEVNHILLKTGRDEKLCFLGAMHKALSNDWDMAEKEPWQGLLQRVRNLMEKKSKVKESSIALQPLNGKHKMGTGMTAKRLTCIPDPAFGVDFGSEPNQEVIGNLAPKWKKLLLRSYENKPLTKYGGKPHYVLGHLLNHQLNGSGGMPSNVTPIWGGNKRRYETFRSPRQGTRVTRGNGELRRPGGRRGGVDARPRTGMEEMHARD